MHESNGSWEAKKLFALMERTTEEPEPEVADPEWVEALKAVSLPAWDEKKFTVTDVDTGQVIGRIQPMRVDTPQELLFSLLCMSLPTVSQSYSIVSGTSSDLVREVLISWNY